GPRRGGLVRPSGTSARAREAARDERREGPARLVLALHNLIKTCLLYADANQAVRSRVPVASTAVAESCAVRATPQGRLLFLDQLVFVNKRILRASRDTTAIGMELGTLLSRAGFNEVTVQRDVPDDSLATFARAVADAPRDPAARFILEEGLAG